MAMRVPRLNMAAVSHNLEPEPEPGSVAPRRHRSARRSSRGSGSGSGSDFGSELPPSVLRQTESAKKQLGAMLAKWAMFARGRRCAAALPSPPAPHRPPAVRR